MTASDPDARRGVGGARGSEALGAEPAFVCALVGMELLHVAACGGGAAAQRVAHGWHAGALVEPVLPALAEGAREGDSSARRALVLCAAALRDLAPLAAPGASAAGVAAAAATLAASAPGDEVRMLAVRAMAEAKKAGGIAAEAVAHAAMVASAAVHLHAQRASEPAAATLTPVGLSRRVRDVRARVDAIKAQDAGATVGDRRWTEWRLRERRGGDDDGLAAGAAGDAVFSPQHRRPRLPDEAPASARTRTETLTQTHARHARDEPAHGHARTEPHARALALGSTVDAPDAAAAMWAAPSPVHARVQLHAAATDPSALTAASTPSPLRTALEVLHSPSPQSLRGLARSGGSPGMPGSPASGGARFSPARARARTPRSPPRPEDGAQPTPPRPLGAAPTLAELATLWTPGAASASPLRL